MGSLKCKQINVTSLQPITKVLPVFPPSLTLPLTLKETQINVHTTPNHPTPYLVDDEQRA